LPIGIAQRLSWPGDCDLLVLVAHPQCPCLPASASIDAIQTSATKLSTLVGATLESNTALLSQNNRLQAEVEALAE
jgi:hypothetical protein